MSALLCLPQRMQKTRDEISRNGESRHHEGLICR